MTHAPPGRHARQARFAPLGAEGQAALARGRVAVVGLGALGSVAADLLARAGVAELRLVDRDVLDASNLHRQALFVEADVAAGLPKAVAAAAHVTAIDASVRVTAHVADLDGMNALDLLRGADVVVDGTDNFEARHVLNEACLELSLPWVHAACLGATAVTWALRPGGACFACLVPDVPSPLQSETCETAGVIGPAVHLAAAAQVAEVMKLLSGRHEALLRGPVTRDAWTGATASVRAERDPACATCARGERRFLGRPRGADVIACGRSAVQIASSGGGPVDLAALAMRLPEGARRTANRWLLRFDAGGRDVTVFRDGRVLVAGTKDPAEARTLCARWLGG